MRIKKSLLTFAGLLALAIFSIYCVSIIYNESKRTWTDTSTWESIPVYTFPAVSSNVSYSVATNESDSTVMLEIPSCTLYGATIKDHTIEYYCSLTPSQLLELDGKVANFTPKKDIVFTYTFEEDPLPNNFFGVAPLDERTFQIVGQEPREVALAFQIKEVKPERTALNMVLHYAKTKSSKKEPYTVKLLSWEMEDSVVAGLKKAGGREKYLEQWRNATIGEVNKELFARNVDKLDGQELLNAIRDVFQYQQSKCSMVTGKLDCKYLYPQNAADSLIFYLYIMGVQNPKDVLYNKILNAVHSKTTPFIQKYNPTYIPPQSPECEVPSEDCVELYQTVNAYQYSICPIGDVINRRETPAVKFFRDYVELAGVSKIPDSITAAQKYISDIEVSKEPNKNGFPDFKSSIEINNGCYAVLKYDIKDQNTLAILEKKYFEGIKNKLSLDNKEQLTQYSQVNDFIIHRSIGNIYTKFPYIGDSSIAFARDQTKLETLAKQIDDQVAWGNVPLSLALAYLSLPSNK